MFLITVLLLFFIASIFSVGVPLTSSSGIENEFADVPETKIIVIKYTLYSEKYLDGIKLFPNKLNFSNIGYQNSFETVIIIQGYEHGDDLTSLKDAYMKLSDTLINVITVKWEKQFYEHQLMTTLADRKDNSIDYIPIDRIGKYVAELINNITVIFKAQVSDIHLIGIGVGCHIAGYVGQHLYSMGQNIGWITGLDPGEPDHRVKWDEKISLSKDSAIFVDVIHTSIDEIDTNKNLGTVDFYANGGTAPQPGCSQSDAVCSHRRALFYYIESLGGNIIAAPCKSYSVFKTGKCCNSKTIISVGDELADIINGGDIVIQYYFNTNCTSPFALGTKGLPAICLDKRISKKRRGINETENTAVVKYEINILLYFIHHCNFIYIFWNT